VPEQLHARIFQSWKEAGEPTLDKFAPYAAFVLSVEVFFQFALAAHLIATERPSNRTDIAYLFYLPFCHAFVSSDRLHERCAPLFMRPDQEFVWGPDLKAGLKSVNETFLELPEAERDRGIIGFGKHPPEGTLVAELWDRHMRKGYRSDPKREKMSPETEKQLVQKLKAFTKESTLSPAEAAADRKDDMLSIQRMVSRKRGSWWQVPKDLKDAPDED
jgi:hypothetical protein